MNWSKPTFVDDVNVVFSTGVDRLMPTMDEIPLDFHKWRGNVWIDLVDKWFFEGLSGNEIVAKGDIDRNVALRHLTAIMRSWEPKHEHKVVAVAYLMSLWFDRTV